MLNRIKKILGVSIVLFCFVSLSIAIMNIWDILSNELAKDAFIKACYTFVIIIVVSVIVSFLFPKNTK